MTKAEIFNALDSIEKALAFSNGLEVVDSLPFRLNHDKEVELVKGLERL